MKPQRYGLCDNIPINKRPRLKWPEGKRIAFWVVPNIETFAHDEKMPAGPGKMAVTRNIR